MILLGCAAPDLAYIDMAAAAAGNMYWSLVTPSTKQLIEQQAGRSWICGSKQLLSEVEQGEQLAQSGLGRFVYGALAGLDIAAYHAFFVSTGAVGVINFANYATKFKRFCDGSQNPNRGVSVIGGWPVPDTEYIAGPSFMNAGGQVFGSVLSIPAGYMGIHIAWVQYSLLDQQGGVRVSQRLWDRFSNVTHDECTVDFFDHPSYYCITQYFSSEGLTTAAQQLELQVKCEAAAGLRMVPTGGGCFAKIWKFGSPPGMSYLNMKQNLNNWDKK